MANAFPRTLDLGAEAAGASPVISLEGWDSKEEGRVPIKVYLILIDPRAGPPIFRLFGGVSLLWCESHSLTAH